MKKRNAYLHMRYLLVFITMLMVCCKPSSRDSGGELDHIKGDHRWMKNEGSAMIFNETSFDFGVVEQGQKVSHVFRFKNAGRSPLLIYGAKGSCGCTVPSHSKGPIMPGDSGMVKVVFDSERLLNFQQKSVTLSTNTPGKEEKLYIKAFVKPLKK